MKTIGLILASALLAGQGYNLVINHKNGQKTIVNIDDIERVTIEEIALPELEPGSTGTVLVEGISPESPFKYDVDKVGDLSPYGWSGDDEDLCWACAGTGMIQWWLDNYKATTGSDYPLVKPIPTESKCYSTSIMDLLINATVTRTGGGETLEFIKWFFAGYYDHPLYGTPSGTSSFNTFGAEFNSSFANWRGGFAGMDWMEATDLLWTTDKANTGYLPWAYCYFFMASNNVDYDMTKDEVAAIFSDLTLEALSKGPLYVCVNANHALSCWGADYRVMDDGSRQITHLYICENNNLAANARATLERFSISYSTSAKFKTKILPILHLAASDSPLPITILGCLKGYGK